MPKARRFLAVLLAALLAAFPVFTPRAAAAAPAPLDGVGMSVADFATVDLTGAAVDASVLSNAAVTVFNIWATWCYPCLMELPDFQTLHEYYEATPEADVQVFGILYYTDPSEIPEAVQLVAEAGCTFDQLIMCDSFYAVAQTMFPDSEGLGVPQTFIVDRGGTVRAQCYGRFWDYQELYEYVDGYYQQISAEEPPAPLPGDVNGDGSVTITDAVTVLRAAMGILGGELPGADFDGDGSVTITDAVLVLRAAMGV